MTQNDILINTPDELIQFIAKEGSNTELLSRVTLGEGFNLRFIVKGEQWLGQIDYRVGRFIYELQRDIFTLYEEATGERLSYKNKYEDISKVLVTIDVRDGSLDLLAKVMEPLTEMVRQMSGKEAAYAVIMSVALWCGGQAFMSYQERLSKAEQLAANIEIESKREQTISQAFDILGKTNIATNNLIWKMDKDDTLELTVDGRERVLGAEEVKYNLPKAITSERERAPISQQVWGTFQVVRQDNQNFSFSLSADGVPLIQKAYPSFTNNDVKADFYQKCQEFLTKNETPVLKLRLSLVIGEKNNIENALILEVLKNDLTDTQPIREAWAQLSEQ